MNDRGPVRRFLAPGRVNLIGEHTDHTDGLVLPAAINLGVALEAELGGERIALTSEGADEQVDVSADGSDAPATGWGRFVAAVAAELSTAGRPPIGMRGRLTSSLPRGAGLSSSAALEVVLALALCAAADFSLEELELARLCRRAEHRAVGVPSGLMDQAASLLGRSGCAVLLDCGTLKHHLVPLPANQTLVVIDTGVRRQLEAGDYAARVHELKAALPVLEGRRPADVPPSELDDLLPRIDPLPGRRLRHVVNENARVLAAADAFRNGDLETIAQLFDQSHASLRDDFEVSTPELDALAGLATKAGATAARMTGAGFGGSIIAIVRTEEAEDLAVHVTHDYKSQFPTVRPTAWICTPSDGAHEVI